MRATDAPTTPTLPTTGAAGTDLHVETWGAGAPVLLVHGSLATGAEEWDAQRPLATAGYRLLVLDRRGYGGSPAAPGEDFLVDASDIADLMGDGAHLVGHSYGGLGVMFAAAQRPEATLSLALLEAPAPTLARDDPAWRALVDDVTAALARGPARRRVGRALPHGRRQRPRPARPGAAGRGRRRSCRCSARDARSSTARRRSTSWRPDVPQARRLRRPPRRLRRHVRRPRQPDRRRARGHRRRRPRDPVHR